jgi:beta-phosphoglucomutase-like phosphatase (HAD superfamily)
MLVLEDSETGTRAAAAAGAVVVSVPNRHTAAGDFSMASLRINSLLDPQLHSILTARRFHLPALTTRGF